MARILATRLAATASAVCWAVSATACWFDAQVEEAAQIECARADDCPPDWSCDADVGLCVPLAPSDGEGPRVVTGSIVVEPNPARVGSLLAITFQTDEPLARPPPIFLDDAERGVAEPSTDPRRWVFRDVVTAQDVEGPHTLRAELRDRFGNERGSSLGVVVFDFTAPDLTGDVTISPSVAAEGDTIVVELSLDEPLGAPATLALADADPSVGTFDEPDEIADGRSRFTLAVSDALPDGVYALTLSATDLAGNAGVRAIGVATVDQSAPSLLDVPRVVPSPAALGDAVTVSIDLSEPIADGATLIATRDADTFALELVSNEDGLLRFRHDVALADDGVWTLALAGAEDLAGNTVAALGAGEMVLDTVPPSVLDYVQDAVDLEGNLVVRFRVDEPLAAAPIVLLGALPLTLVDGPDPYQFTALVTPADVGADAATPIVRIVDVAGNPGLFLGQPVLFDTTPPALSSATFSPPIVGVGQVALLTIVVNEPLALDPVLTFEPVNTPVTLVQHAAQSLSWTYLVAASDEDVVLTSIDVEDLAGNLATLPVTDTRLTVDDAPPSMSALTIGGDHFSATSPFNEVVLAFTVDRADTPAHLISAAVGNEAMECMPLSQTDWECTYVIPPSVAEGFMPVYATVLDEAGNRTSAGFVVRIDLTGPSCSSTPAALADGAGITTTGLPLLGTAAFDVTCEEEIQAPVLSLLPLTLAFTATLPLGSTGEWWRMTSAPLADGAHDGAHAPSATLRDVVGNETTVALTDSSILVDTTPPAAPDRARIVAHAAPWGDATSTAVVQRIDGAVGAAEAAGVVAAYETAVDNALLVKADVGADGAFALAIGAPIVEDLYVEVVDGAGNRSPRTRVTQHELLASARGSSPVRYRMGAKMFLGRRTPLGSTSVTAARVGEADLVTHESTITGYRWSEQGAYRSRPGALTGTAAAYHRGAGLGVIIGGTEYVTWAYLGRSGVLSLNDRVPFPTALAYSAATYDAARGTVVAFGGRTSAGALVGSTFLFDGATFSIAPASGSAPPPRQKTALAFDRVRNVVVMFGGQTGAAATNVASDLWEWDGSTWTERPTAGTWPAPRAGHVMAWDDANAKVMICSGLSATGTVLRDCYHLDESGFTDAPAIPAYGGGTPQAGGQLLEVDDANELWLTAIDSRATRVARWTGAAWQLDGWGGPPFAFAGAYYDPERAEILQCGSGWLFRSRGGVWRTEPVSRTYDVEINRVSSASGYGILPGYGYETSYGPLHVIDTSWSELPGADGAGAPPQPHWAFGLMPSGHAFALEPEAASPLFYGRDDFGPAWWPRPSPPVPMPYDVLGGRGQNGALFVTQSETLQFNDDDFWAGAPNQGWTVYAAPAPPSLWTWDQLFFDARPGRNVASLLHFDGYDAQLWDFNATVPAWQQRTDVAPLPTALSSITAVTVTPDGLYLVEFDANTVHARQWRLDESTAPMSFVPIEVDIPLPARSYRGAPVQDLPNPTFVVATAGDQGAPAIVVLERDLNARPLHLFEVPLSLAPGAVTNGALTQLEVRTRARGGRSGAPGPYQVYVWCGREYRLVGTVDAAAFSLATTSLAVDDTCTLGADRTLTVGIAPSGDVGDDQGALAVDLVEATIHFVIP